MRSSFLEPQIVIDHYLEEIQDLEAYKTVESFYNEFSSKPIPEEFFLFLRESLRNYDDVYSPEKVVNVNEYDGYRWTQEGDLITISYEFQFEGDVDEKDIEITKPNNIESPFCSGKFYSDLNDHDIKINGKKITIQLQVSDK